MEAFLQMESHQAHWKEYRHGQCQLDDNELNDLGQTSNLISSSIKWEVGCTSFRALSLQLLSVI